MGTLLSEVGDPYRTVGSYLGVGGLRGAGLSLKGLEFRMCVSREERVSACLFRATSSFQILELMSVSDAWIFLISSLRSCTDFAAAYEFPWADPADSFASLITAVCACIRVSS